MPPPSAAPMRRPVLLLFLLIAPGCETTKNGGSVTATPTANTRPTANSIPKQTPTRIVFNTSDLIYTGGLGGVTSNLDPSTAAAKITVTLSTIETKSGGGLNFLTGVGYTVQKLRAKYSATLESPSGATLATWNHEVDEEGVDKLTEHMAADIVKYLKKGFSP